MSEELWRNIKNILTNITIRDRDDEIYLICGLCKNIMIEPFQIICGCRFCKQCLVSYIGNGYKSCFIGDTEVCRNTTLRSIHDAHFDKESKEKIFKLSVRCPIIGCDAEKSLAEMLEHMKECRENTKEIDSNLLETKMQSIEKTMNYFIDRFSGLATNLAMKSESLLRRLENIVLKMKEDRNDSFIWRIQNYSEKKRINRLIISEFIPKGYKIRMSCWPNGDCNNGEYISLFFQLLNGDNDDVIRWPFEYDISLSIINQKSLSRVHCRRIKYRPSPECIGHYKKPDKRENLALGFPEFLSISLLESSENLLDNDTVYISCHLEKV